MNDKEIIELIQEIVKLRKENENLKDTIRRIKDYDKTNR